MTDLDEFFTKVQSFAKINFNKFGEHMPMFYVDVGSKIDILPAPWQTNQQKEQMLAVMRMGVEMDAIKFCSFVTEVWFSVVDKPESRVVDMANITPPSQDPDRQEMLMVIAIDKIGHRIIAWEIKRGSGKPKLVAFRHGEEGSFEAISGGFRAFTGGAETRQ